MTTTTSLKLPDELKAQIAMTAKREGKTAHALMVEVLQTAMNEASLMRAFQDSALAAYEETVRINKVSAVKRSRLIIWPSCAAKRQKNRQ